MHTFSHFGWFLGVKHLVSPNLLVFLGKEELPDQVGCILGSRSLTQGIP